MVSASKITLSEIAGLLVDWPRYVQEAVANPKELLNASEEARWATQVSGDVEWAFEELHQVIKSDLQEAVLQTVVTWGMAGMLRAMLVSLDKGPKLADKFDVCLREGGYVPMIWSLPADD